MTLQDILNACYDDLNEDVEAPAPKVTRRFTRWTNEGHDHILRLPEFQLLRHGTLPFSSETNRRVYGFPQAFERIDFVVQQSNQIRLVLKTQDFIRSLDPGDTSTGNPYVRVDLGVQVLQRQPESTGVWVVSDDAADSTQLVSMLGVSATGYDRAEDAATLTGTVRVQIGALTNYVLVKRLTLSATCAGTVSVYDAAAAGNLLASIPPGRTSVQYQGMRLWPTPSAPLDYLIDGQLLIPKLVHATDTPMLPDSYHEMLQCYVRRRQYKKDGDPQRFSIEDREWETWKGKLNSFVEFNEDYNPIASVLANQGVRWNNLGGWYPADGWGRG